MQHYLKLSSTCLLLLVTACASAPPLSDGMSADGNAKAVDNPWTRTCQTSAAEVPAAWQFYRLPGKQATQYVYAHLDGREVMVATAESSASLLRQKLRMAPQALGNIKFSWKVPALIANADLAVRESADSPVRIVLAFEGDRTKFSVKNAMLSELSHALTGEPLPYATLMYVWCNACTPGSVINSARTDRIRNLVVESGAKNLNQWLDYQRDIRADFEKTFGEPPGALIGIGLMTDTDNTQTSAQAWYGAITLLAASPSEDAGNVPHHLLTTLSK